MIKSMNTPSDSLEMVMVGEISVATFLRGKGMPRAANVVIKKYQQHLYNHHKNRGDMSHMGKVEDMNGYWAKG